MDQKLRRAGLSASSVESLSSRTRVFSVRRLAMIDGISTLLGRGRAAGLWPTRTRTTPVFQQSNTPALHHSVPSLSVETKTLLHIFFGAVCAWLVLRTVPKLYKGPLEAIDNYLLRVLRRPDNPAIPIGPKWLPQAAKDVTALGSGTNLTIVTGILVGFLCLNRRFRATGFLLSSLGSGLLLSQSLKGLFARRRPTAVPHLVDFDPASFPSGHSMGAALVYLTLGSIISRQVSGLRAKTYFLSAALVLAVIVGISRVYLGVHYPSDVLAGWAAGSLWSGLCAQVARWLQHQGSVEPPTETGEAAE